MVLAVILRRSTRAHHLRSLLQLHLQNSPSLHYLSSSLSSFSSPSSSSPINFHLKNPLASSLSSDFSEPISPSSDPHLSSLLHLISISKSHSSAPQHALNLLRSSAVEPTEDLVCSALWALRSDWESAVVVFKWAKDRVMGWPKAWHLMIWVLGTERRFDLAWSLVRRMHRKSVLTTTAMEILIERNVEEAEDLLLLNRKFFPLQTEGFNIILDGWCNIIVDVVEAKRVWREMANCCITPDGTSYSHLICCFSKVCYLFDALRLYDQMKKRGWVPGLVIYNSLIYALTKEDCLKEAQNTFDKILEAGLRPDIETYNSMIYPLCEAHKLEEARLMMDDMIKNGIHPTIETYHAFAKAEDIEGTLKLLKRMKDVGCGPDSNTFLHIFDKFFRLDESESALRIWSEMMMYNVIPDTSHYTTLVQGLAMHGWIPKAMEFYSEMRSKGFSGDPKLEMLFKTFVSSSKNHWGRGKEFISTPRGKQKPPGVEDTRLHERLGKLIF